MCKRQGKNALTTSILTGPPGTVYRLLIEVGLQRTSYSATRKFLTKNRVTGLVL